MKGVSIGVSQHLFILSLLCCASCTSQTKLESAPVKNGMAQIFIKRVGSFLAFGASSARIEVNGILVASLSANESYTGDLTPGQTTIAVSGNLLPGRYVINFEADAGKTYHFAVEPRGDSSIGIPAGFAPSEANGVFRIRPNSGE